MGKIGNVSYKDKQLFFENKKKRTFLVYPTFANFIQRKRKTYGAINLLVFSLCNVIVCIYCLGKKFYCAYSKTTLRDEIF